MILYLAIQQLFRDLQLNMVWPFAASVMTLISLFPSMLDHIKGQSSSLWFSLVAASCN
jgi:hypothetical protein